MVAKMHLSMPAITAAIVYDGNLPLGKCLQGVSSRRRKPLSNAAVKTILSLQSEPKYLECLHQTMTFCPCSLYNKHVVLIYYPWIEQTESAKTCCLPTFDMVEFYIAIVQKVTWGIFCFQVSLPAQDSGRHGEALPPEVLQDGDVCP